MITQIYEVQNAHEAKKLIEIGVDYIGVLVGNGAYPGERSLKEANEIFNAVKGKAKRIALSLQEKLEDVLLVASEVEADVIHLPAPPESLSPDDVRTIKKRFPNLGVMRTIPVVGEECVLLAKQYDGVADYLLLDSKRKKDGQIGATGETHDWNLSRQIVEAVSIPVILAGGLGPDNIEEAIQKVHPFGVDSKTKTDKPGSNEKDLEKVRLFIARAKQNA